MMMLKYERMSKGKSLLSKEGGMNKLIDGINFILINAQVGIELGATGWSFF